MNLETTQLWLQRDVSSGDIGEKKSGSIPDRNLLLLCQQLGLALWRENEQVLARWLREVRDACEESDTFREVVELVVEARRRALALVEASSGLQEDAPLFDRKGVRDGLYAPLSDDEAVKAYQQKIGGHLAVALAADSQTEPDPPAVEGAEQYGPGHTNLTNLAAQLSRRRMILVRDDRPHLAQAFYEKVLGTLRFFGEVTSTAATTGPQKGLSAHLAGERASGRV